MDSNGIGSSRKIRLLKGDVNTQDVVTTRSSKQVSIDAVKISKSDKTEPNKQEISYNPQSIVRAKRQDETEEYPRLTAEEATQLAEKIGRTLKVSSSAFGKDAAIFNDLDSGRVRELLR